MPDAVFDDPRLAALDDPLEADRPDLDVYAALVAELDASSVLDLGCGTGELACRLAVAGLEVVGVDPAGASLDVARRKPGAADVHWVLGDATTLPDLALMRGNVAQVFLTDEDWDATLRFRSRVELEASLASAGFELLEVRDAPDRPGAEWVFIAMRPD